MNKIITLAAILSLALVASMIITPTVIAMPRIKRLMDFYVATIEGGSPQTVDYSWAYDTASGEIIFNTMDTLVMFNESHTDQYVGNIASSWSIVNLGAGGIDSGIPITGLTFENPVNQTGPDAMYYYRYVFNLNTSAIFFQTFPNGTQGYQLTAADVVYSFQRTLVQDRLSGPSWMLYEPLLDNNIGGDASAGGVADLTDPTQVAELGRLIEGAVTIGGNPNQIYFNLMFPGAYAPFMQILTQTWSSIESKKWIQNEVISQAGRPDWNGDIAAGGYTDWVNFHNPTVSPLDDPTPMCYGSGPFCLVPGTPDYVNNYWAMTRYFGYFRGWPASFPPLNPNYRGYVNTVEVTWAFDWATRKMMFMNGDCDFCALPSTSFISQLYQSATPPFDPPNYPQNGVRCIHPLPTLQVDAMFFTFEINTATTYQKLSPVGTFRANAIPPDFFGNSTWGIHVRRGFAYAFDYATFLASASLGEGLTQPDVATALISGLRYYNKTLADQVGFNYNLAAATAEFNQVPGLMATGFTLNLTYNTGNLERKTACDLLQTALTTINPKFKTAEVNIDWSHYLTAAVYQNLPFFVIGRQADYPDAHDFVFPFYHTGGAFASWQAYSNSTLDALIDKGILTPDDLTPYSSAPWHHERQDIYNQIVKAAIQDVPSVTILQGVGRHFERDWVNGWYYNELYPGNYFYNLWKYYYVTPARYNVTYTYSGLNQPNSTNLPADVNYDGGVDITDVATVAKAFGSVYGPPSGSRWIQRGDLNNDRKIDISDVAYCAKQFGKKTTPLSAGKWTPQGLLVTVNPIVRTMAAGQTYQFNSTVIGGTGPYTYAWYYLFNSTDFQPASTVPVATTANYVFTSPGNGNWFIKLYANDTGTNKGESPLIFVLTRGLFASISPSTAWLASGQTLTFTSTVTGGILPYAYEWYMNNTVLTGETGSTYAFTSPGDGTYNFTLRVTDSALNTVDSNTAWVYTAPFAASIEPASATLNVALGESQTFTSTATGGTKPYSYQWYDNTTGPYLPVLGETGSTYAFTPTTSGVYGVYLLVTDSSVPAVSVQSATSIVIAVFSVSIAPASAMLNVTKSESQVFSSTVTDATLPISYQWYDNTTGPYLPVLGETGSTYAFTPTTSGVYGVYLLVTDSSVPAVSVQSATSIVIAVFSVSIAPASAMLNVTKSESQVFSSTVTDATLPISYQWYDNTAGPYLPVLGETGSTYAFTPTTSRIYGVYLVVTDSSSVPVSSATSIVIAVS